MKNSHDWCAKSVANLAGRSFPECIAVSVKTILADPDGPNPATPELKIGNWKLKNVNFE